MIGIHGGRIEGARYDPHEHAHSMDIDIVYRPLRSANGLWVPEHRVIFLRPRLHRVHERSTLAHELVHAEYGDLGRSDFQERRADKVAARRLIRTDDLRQAVDLSDDPGAWALELDVTDHMMRVYMRQQRAA
jgi:Zn-dependent peptidase ImmA (M78 family)